MVIDCSCLVVLTRHIRPDECLFGRTPGFQGNCGYVRDTVPKVGPKHGRITANGRMRLVPGGRNTDDGGPSAERYGRMANIRKTDNAAVCAGSHGAMHNGHFEAHVQWPCVVVVTVVLPVEEGVVELDTFNPLRGTICETRIVPLPVGFAARWRLTPHPASPNTPTATLATIETCRLIRMPPRGVSSRLTHLLKERRMERIGYAQRRNRRPTDMRDGDHNRREERNAQWGDAWHRHGGCSVQPCSHMPRRPEPVAEISRHKFEKESTFIRCGHGLTFG